MKQYLLVVITSVVFGACAQTVLDGAYLHNEKTNILYELKAEEGDFLTIEEHSYEDTNGERLMSLRFNFGLTDPYSEKEDTIYKQIILYLDSVDLENINGIGYFAEDESLMVDFNNEASFKSVP